jgi:hypothetical protein
MRHNRTKNNGNVIPVQFRLHEEELIEGLTSQNRKLEQDKDTLLYQLEVNARKLRYARLSRTVCLVAFLGAAISPVMKGWIF